MHRRFEFVGGSSAKFWEVCVNGSEVAVRFGRIGGDGQTQAKDLANYQQAQQHAAKLIAAKTKKGYRETTASVS